jgi:hypothetical protein
MDAPNQSLSVDLGENEYQPFSRKFKTRFLFNFHFCLLG